ncbi:histidine phosphatase family protein [Actinomadura sp. 1N219]|uniref:histidine phosphatase family protein n=1 Tax=Actinomadura sp. 1N219 TaxID=3375152 RepID=UPI0037A2BF24
MGELILLRHGETEWSRTRRHTGRTDVPLTARGEDQARALRGALGGRRVLRTVASPAERARRTAALAGLPVDDVDPDLWEWDYGGYEGITSAAIREDRPGWYLWDDGVVPGDADHPGETVEQVGRRADAVLARVRPLLAGDDGGEGSDGGGDGGDVVLVAHGHVLRVLTARWLGLEPARGRSFALETGTVSTLGAEHGRPVITAWNVPAP